MPNRAVVVSNGDDGGFDGLAFDEDFVRRAATREPSAEDRARRAQQELDEDRRIAALRAAHRAGRRQRRRGRLKRIGTWVVLLVVVAGVVAYQLRTDRRGQGSSGETAAPPTTAAATPEWESPPADASAVGPSADHPTPSRARASVRMSSRPEPPPETGHFRFLSTQLGSDAPVAYDPCRVIRVVINERTMPPAAKGLVQDVLEDVGHRTGLSFEVEGATDETPSPDRADFQPMRYGDRWAPVLVTWSDPAEDPRLEGGTAGIAGSSFVETPRGAVYVTGDLSLDGPDIGRIISGFGRRGQLYAADVVRHEVGHLVGLDHVDDPSEVMFPQSRTPRLVGFGPGDLRGLYEVGGGDCVPEI